MTQLFPHTSHSSCTLLAVCFFSAVGTADVSPTQLRTIRFELVPAFIDGDSLTTANLATQLMNATSVNERKQIDAILQREGAMPLTDLSVKSRMELIRSGYTGEIVPPTEEEIRLLLAAVADEIKIEIASVTKAMRQASESSTLDQFEEFIWQTHVAKNRLYSAKRLADRGLLMAAFNRARLNEQDGAERDEARDAFHDSSARIADALHNTDEHAILLRIQRIAVAEKVLQASEDIEQRLMAAWVGDSDGPIVQRYFQLINDGSLQASEKLKVPGIAESAAANVQEIQTLAGPELLAKSRNFFVGLHWWLRGRYGAGPHGFGMLKDPTAMISGEKLFGLYMPMEMPTPTAPYDEGYSIPDVDRRHHYIWMFEYRRLFRQESQSTVSSGRKKTDKVTSRTQLPRFY